MQNSLIILPGVHNFFWQVKLNNASRIILHGRDNFVLAEKFNSITIKSGLIWSPDLPEVNEVLAAQGKWSPYLPEVNEVQTSAR